MARILGLDAATKKTGYSILDDNYNILECGVIRTTSSDVKERLKEIYIEIEKKIIENKIDCLVAEDVPVTKHNNLKTGKDLSTLQGIILSLCFRYNVDYTFYNPSAWRSLVGTYDGTREGMKRQFQKQRAVDLINKLYGLDFVYNETETKTRTTDDDKAEAILIARAFLIERSENK